MLKKKTSLIPAVDTDIFIGNLSNFAMKRIDSDNIPLNSNNNELVGALELRKNVYSEMGFLDNVKLGEGGTDWDEDDMRSVSFVLLERVAVDGCARVIGNMRLVKKNNYHPEPLFVEHHFPEYFRENSIPNNSVEVGRLVSQHENPKVQMMAKWALFVGALTYVNKEGYPRAFGLMASDLVRGFISQGVPIEVLADPKYIPEINAKKQPIEINLPSLGKISRRKLGWNPSLTEGPVSYVDDIIRRSSGDGL